MRRPISQLRAISYAYAKARYYDQQAEMKALGVDLLRKYSNYKTDTGFLNAVKHHRVNLIKELTNNIENGRINLQPNVASQLNHLKESVKK